MSSLGKTTEISSRQEPNKKSQIPAGEKENNASSDAKVPSRPEKGKSEAEDELDRSYSGELIVLDELDTETDSTSCFYNKIKP